MRSSRHKLLDELEERTVDCTILHESDMLLTHGPAIWRAKEFTGTPHFYPVYKYQDMYSHSLLSLILKKRRLVLDQKVLEITESPYFTCVMSNQVLDKEITRIGCAHKCNLAITNVDTYAQLIASAIKEDISTVERANPGFVNVVLCGGSDSLNLLLLPWKNETIALSAEPNYQYVKKFVTQNQLNIKVLRLDDEVDLYELDDEIMECCCRVDLAHWRWGGALRRVAKEMDKKLVYWKGQAGDLYMSATWMAYMHPIQPASQLFRRVYRKTNQYMPDALAHYIGQTIQPSVIQATWNRTASLQGSHMGFIREIADCLTISAYHGPAVMKVWEQVDLAAVARQDMRPKVGHILLGRDVVYPQNNPSPAPSSFRKGLSNPQRFFDLLKQTGIKIIT